MEGNNWHNENGYVDYRNQQDSEGYPINPSSYRGAYRLDTESADHNKTTYNGFDRDRSPDNRRAGDFDHRHDVARDRSDTYRNDRGSQNYNNAYQQQKDRYNKGNYEYRPERNSDYNSSRNRYEDRDPYGLGNFNSNYGPDHYSNGGGENYGNMAGSQSYGYDGSSNSNHDQNRYYNPLSGRHHSYHGNYTSRYPNFYNEGERRRHPDDFRSLDH